MKTETSAKKPMLQKTKTCKNKYAEKNAESIKGTKKYWKTKKVENKILTDAINNADASNINQIVDILLNVNAFQDSRDIAKAQSNKALKSIAHLPDSKYKTALILLCELSLERSA